MLGAKYNTRQPTTHLSKQLARPVVGSRNVRSRASAGQKKGSGGMKGIGSLGDVLDSVATVRYMVNCDAQGRAPGTKD